MSSPSEFNEGISVASKLKGICITQPHNHKTPSWSPAIYAKYYSPPLRTVTGTVAGGTSAGGSFDSSFGISGSWSGSKLVN